MEWIDLHWLEVLQLFVPALVGGFIAWRLSKVHQLVNSRLTAALDKISQLENQIGRNIETIKQLEEK